MKKTFFSHLEKLKPLVPFLTARRLKKSDPIVRLLVGPAGSIITSYLLTFKKIKHSRFIRIILFASKFLPLHFHFPEISSEEKLKLHPQVNCTVCLAITSLFVIHEYQFRRSYLWKKMIAEVGSANIEKVTFC